MQTKEFQIQIFNSLREIFIDQVVKPEWNSTKYDSHFSNHKEVYAPFIDVAVSPYNSFANLDIGTDNTEIMKHHPFTRRIVEEIGWDKKDFKKCWNKYSRCYLAIEIELSGKKYSNSLKHILGSMINASVTGSIGIIITDSNTEKVVSRLFNYLRRLQQVSGILIPIVDNLVRIEQEAFTSLLTEVKKNVGFAD